MDARIPDSKSIFVYSRGSLPEEYDSRSLMTLGAPDSRMGPRELPSRSQSRSPNRFGREGSAPPDSP